VLSVERVAALHRVEMFADVPGSVLAAVARRATEVVVGPGEVVVEEGAVEDHLFVVVDGRVRIHHGEHTIRELRAGSTVGELAALVPEPRSASATAVERTTLLRLDKAVLDELLADRPTLAAGIIRALVLRLRERRADEPPVDAGLPLDTGPSRS
jgi:CRP-like cAMP-binding protein